MVIQTPQPALEIHNLTVSYRDKPAIWNIDFTIPEGVLGGIIGPNGAGKSTVLKAAMDLVPVSSGHVRIFGKPLSEVRQRVSYVPQRESVDWDFPASAIDVVLMGRYGKRSIWSRLQRTDHDIAMDCLRKVQLQDFAHRQIAQLSGGQQQRVFIARALAQEADIYLMDEPFAGIDAATENAILELLSNMRNEGKTILVVHHDLQSAYEYFDWIVMLNTRLVASGPKDTVFNAQLLGEAYGAKLTMLSRMANLLKQREFPVQE